MTLAETPLQVALRWRAENAALGRSDQRGATLITAARMDLLTAASIVAQRLWAREVGAFSNESDIFAADVDDFEVVAASRKWGVWDKPAFKAEAVVIVYAQEPLMGWIDRLDLPDDVPLGWTTVDVIRALPIDEDAPRPNRHLPLARLFEMVELDLEAAS